MGKKTGAECNVCGKQCETHGNTPELQWHFQCDSCGKFTCEGCINGDGFCRKCMTLDIERAIKNHHEGGGDGGDESGTDGIWDYARELAQLLLQSEAVDLDSYQSIIYRHIIDTEQDMTLFKKCIKCGEMDTEYGLTAGRCSDCHADHMEGGESCED